MKKKNSKKSLKSTPSEGGSVGAFYGLGFLGALIYYIVSAQTFWAGLFGVLKALVWPAFFVFELLKFVGA